MLLWTVYSKFVYFKGFIALFEKENMILKSSCFQTKMVHQFVNSDIFVEKSDILTFLTLIS